MDVTEPEDIKKRWQSTKETISKVKRQPSEWEKIIANEATYKELISKNIEATPAAQFQKNKPRDKKKWTKELNRHFSKENIQMANKHMKRCSTSLITHYVNQNHNRVPPHTCQHGCYQKVYKQ